MGYMAVIRLYVLSEHTPLDLVGAGPVGAVELGPGCHLSHCQTDQSHAFLRAAVFEHAQRRGHQHDGALREGIAMSRGLLSGPVSQRLIFKAASAVIGSRHSRWTISNGCESRMALIAGASFIEFRQRWR